MDDTQRLGFREIADQVRQAIMDGRYPPATLLPPEPQLAASFGASRSLVNRAMQVLAAEGMVSARQGRGTTVTWIPPLRHSPSRYSRQAREGNGARGAFDAEIKAIGLVPQHEISTRRATPPDIVAEILRLPKGEVNCVVRRRRLLASGISIRLNESWFPLSIAADTVLEDPDAVIIGGVKSALADLGYTQSDATERITVRPPDPTEINRLEISPDRTVFDICHIGIADGRPVEVTTTVTPAHYLVIETAFPLT